MTSPFQNFCSFQTQFLEDAYNKVIYFVFQIVDECHRSLDLHFVPEFARSCTRKVNRLIDALYGILLNGGICLPPSTMEGGKHNTYNNLA